MGLKGSRKREYKFGKSYYLFDMASGSDVGFEYPDNPASAEIRGYMFEPPPCEPVNQPDSDDQGTDIRYDIRAYIALVI